MRAAATQTTEDDHGRKLPAQVEGMLAAGADVNSELILALTSLTDRSDNFSNFPNFSSEYSATIPADSKAELTLVNQARTTAANLSQVALILEGINAPNPTKDKLPNLFTVEATNDDTKDSQIIMRTVGTIATILGVAVYSLGGTTAGPILFAAAAGLILGAALLSGEMRDWIKQTYNSAKSTIHDFLAPKVSTIEAKEILRKIDSQIESGSFSKEERPALLREIISNLRQRSKGYLDLASQISEEYNNQKGVRLQLMRDHALQLERYAEKAAVKKSLPASITINISAITDDPKLAEELSSFIETCSPAEISRSGPKLFSEYTNKEV